jgi:murein DD-endopeptidase MepM/ murein hydrolase activator NlpD
MRYIVFTLMVLALAGCGSYRSGSSGYQGVGGWKSPSDYEQDPTTRNFYLSENSGRGQNYFPSGEFKLYWPVSKVKINRGYRPASAPRHEGLDLGGKKGSPILSAHEGLVIYAGRDFRGYGNMVMIEFNREWATLYGHLNTITAREGMIVKPGDPIGTMGRTGHATGVHLHFELIHNKTPIDPLERFQVPNSGVVASH